MNDRESPDTLRPDAGVSRLNKRPLAIVVVALGAIVLALTYGILAKSRRVNARPSKVVEKHVVQATGAAAAALAKDAPKAGPIPERPAGRFRTGPKAGLITAAIDPSKTPSETPNPELEAFVEQRRRSAARRLQMLETALTATTKVATVDELSSRMARGENKGTNSDAVGPSVSSFAPGNSPLRSGLAGAEDPNKQTEKLSFAEAKGAVGYLLHTRQQPLSSYELKAGTVIPAILVSGVNSDLPGQIIAQVSQNVYDTATGDYLLIPQGSKLVGIYDSRISVGQSRVQVAWTRLNFPDASTLELGNMPGTDQAGGLASKTWTPI